MARLRKRWYAVANASISIFSGTTSPPTKRIQSQKPIAPLIPRPILVQGACDAGWEYFVSFQQAAKDFAQLSQTKLTMPVLAIGGEKANGDVLGKQMKLVATDATMIVLKDCGHWVLEEKQKETIDALLKFL